MFFNLFLFTFLFGESVVDGMDKGVFISNENSPLWHVLSAKITIII